MTLSRQKQIERFAKLAATVLGHCPHEFGLVPDADGFVKTKEFLQAIAETDGWRHVRISHVSDIMLMMADPPVEIDQAQIRAKDRSRLPACAVSENPPGLLYVCVRQKSYPAVLTDGVRPSFFPRVVCCRDPEMARRIGRRRDPAPVLLTVHVSLMKSRNLPIFQAGEGLFLADAIPPDCFTGPPLPKDLPETKRTEKKPDPLAIYQQQTLGGTFYPDLSSMQTPSGKPEKTRQKGKNPSWKQNKKRLRKEKHLMWPDE